MLFGVSSWGTFLPEDQISPLASLTFGNSNITESEFNQEINRISNIYAPIISANGGKLNMSGDWKSEKINAAARQMFGSWQVVITGGLARRPELTLDAMTLILCHELGHHLGGFAFAPATPIPIPVPGADAWAANEGQSDYYATHVCAHNVWGNDLERNAEFRNTTSVEIKSYCDSVWSNTDEQNLCYRNLTAAESVAFTMAALKKDATQPSFETPDQSVTDKTNNKHPATQCRMDTSFQGALCLANFDESIIPGKKAAGGVDSVEAEREALSNSCSSITGFDIGQRPACWFKSRVN